MDSDERSEYDEHLELQDRRIRRRSIETTVLFVVAVALAAASLTLLTIALMRTAGW